MRASEFHKVFGDDADFWAEHPVFPLADWQSEVAEDNTRLGYWDWVQSEAEMATTDAGRESVEEQYPARHHTTGRVPFAPSPSQHAPQPTAMQESPAMYHVTRADSLSSILANGLVPQIGERSAELGETQEAVYAFPSLLDCREALAQWLGDWFNDQEEVEGSPIALVILELDAGVLAPGAIKREVPWECSIAQRVPPEAIVRVLSERDVAQAAGDLAA